MRSDVLDQFYAREGNKPPPYRGQLDPEFQAELAAHHRDVVEADCDFYHTIEFPDGRMIAGAWDLRGHEHEYLGNVDLTRKRVIEFGPASGMLSTYMAEKGADLTVFDIPLGKGPEIVPFLGNDDVDIYKSGVESMTRLRNSWWYTRRVFGHTAAAVYGDIYNPPDDLGRFDVGVFGAILVHLSCPFRALQRAAAMIDTTLIVTELVAIPPLPQFPGLMQFSPTDTPQGLVHWHSYSANAFQVMMARLGFVDQTITLHSPKAMSEKPPMVTIVGHRPGKPEV